MVYAKIILFGLFFTSGNKLANLPKCPCNFYLHPLYYRLRADVAQAVEHLLGKEEVMGSSPIISSR